MRLREIMDMRCREQPEKWDDSGRDTKGCSSERHIYFWNLIKKLIHSSGNFYKSGSGEQPFVKRKWNRASLTVEASLALPVFLIAVLVLLKIVDLYRLHGMLTVSLQESARYLSVCAYAVDETGKETYEIPETAACIAYAEAKIPKEIRENGIVTLAGSRVKNGWLELKAIYWPKMGNRLVPVRNRGIAACAKVHLFCGKTEEEADEEEGEAKQMVWVTENGSVYHTDSSCSHINLSIQVSSPGALAWKRNQDGEKYKECEQCVGNGAAGAEVLVYHEVTALIQEQGRVVGVTVLNHKTKTEHNYYAPLTINAGGIWGHGIAAKAGIRVDMFPAKGSLLIFGHRINNVVLNRCRKPANADILVPGDTICLIGTTSSRVGFDEVDDVRVTPEEVDLLLSEGEKLAPALATTRILRAYAGVRPLVAADNDPSGRNISRGIVLLDHEVRDGVPGFVTITGGKLMTYRLMAEWATDLACKKLGIDKPCITMNEPLPGSRMEEDRSGGKQVVAEQPKRSSVGRHGEMAARIASESKYDNSLVCECEDVTVGEVNYAVNELDVHNLIDLRRRTRVGMGTCQGELCACRAAGLLGEAHNCSQKAKEDLASFLNERWKGLYPVAWGEALRESEYTQWIYGGVCGME